MDEDLMECLSTRCVAAKRTDAPPCMHLLVYTAPFDHLFCAPAMDDIVPKEDQFS